MIKHLLSCLYTVCDSHTLYQLNRFWMFTYFANVLLFIKSNRMYSSMCVWTVFKNGCICEDLLKLTWNYPKNTKYIIYIWSWLCNTDVKICVHVQNLNWAQVQDNKTRMTKKDGWYCAWWRLDLSKHCTVFENKLSGAVISVCRHEKNNASLFSHVITLQNVLVLEHNS